MAGVGPIAFIGIKDFENEIINNPRSTRKGTRLIQLHYSRSLFSILIAVYSLNTYMFRMRNTEARTDHYFTSAFITYEQSASDFETVPLRGFVYPEKCPY